MSIDASLPPAILVGGGTANAMSVARSLGRQGVAVHLLCRSAAPITFSRYARRLEVDDNLDEWLRFLLGPQSDRLRGAVLLACSDDGVEMLLEHRESLARKYVLDICEPQATRCFLDKLSTYRAARDAGIPTPLFWPAEDLEQVRAHRDEYVYPLLVKPLYAHKFKRQFAGKYLVVHDFAELLGAYERVSGRGVQVLLLEEIPGPDDRLCSCYTYVDERGTPLFYFTKRIIRRYPEHQGFGSYHITDWSPEVLDLGLRLVKHVGFLGLANVEFKRDYRDGRLKVIECNVRFTAANEILVASGYDLPLFVYNRLIGRPQPSLGATEYRRGQRLWYPLADLLALVEQRKRGKLTVRAWISSVLHAQALPYFHWDDPVPSLVLTKRYVRRMAWMTVKWTLRRGLADLGPRDESGETPIP